MGGRGGGGLAAVKNLQLRKNDLDDAVLAELARLKGRRTAGLIGWTGSQADADFVALSPELDPQEGA